MFAVAAFQWWSEATALGEAHLRLDSTHKGWSFPGRVFSGAVAPDAPLDRLLEEARARGYAERCPAPGPGELCEASGRVVPRDGAALEPLLLGWLIGPDAELREHLPLEEAPPHLVHAILAAEDRAFWTHHGVRPLSLLRAALANAREGGWAQGGSTLSMQVARAFSGQREKRLWRKLREAVTAAALDHTLGKHAILQAYLDAPYLAQRGGLSVCGFQAGARHYFGKDARALDLAEAATLAAILPAPGRLAPDRDPKLARERRDRVLRAMAELYGYDVSAALGLPLKVAGPAPLAERHPAYLSAVRAWLEERLPREAVYARGLVVTAGVDLTAQRRTEELFAQKTPLLDPGRAGAPLQSAGVLLDFGSGRVLAVWGGLGMKSTDFNRATQARRQPGSAFKPLVYALAFGQPPEADGRPRFTAASLEPNHPRVFHTEQGDWRPRNASDEYSQTASLAEGLVWSRNVATASLLERLGGPRALLGFAGRLGFDAGRLPQEMGLALGQGEVTVLQMAQLAGTLANGGLALSGTPVLRAVDLQGREWAAPPKAGERVMSLEAASLTRDLLGQVLEAGTGGGARRGEAGEPGVTGPAFGKTGTTDGERDVWFVGATPAGAAALWLGYDTPTGVGASASQLAAPLWGWWMRRIGAGSGGRGFAGGVELSHRWICATTGRLAGPDCRALRAPFLPGSEPAARCHGDHPERLLELLEQGAVPGLPAE